MSIIDKTYHHLLQTILDDGFTYEDPNRKDINRIQIPSYTFTHDFKDGFPAITTKKLYWKGVVGELLWFLRGDTNIKYLVDNGINIWNKDAYNYYKKLHSSDTNLPISEFLEQLNNGVNIGDLGRVYGAQWRNWGHTKYQKEGLDQISNLINGLKETPMGTKHIVTAWNPAELDDMALPPCHWSFEVLIEPLTLLNRCKLGTFELGQTISDLTCDKQNIPKYQFTLKWHQRSVDTFLGLPFNIASYALLAQIIGKLTNMVPKSLIGDLSNVHIYEPHLDAVKEQLSKDVNKHDKCELNIYDDMGYLEHTTLEVDSKIQNLKIKDFTLDGYKSYPRIPAEMLAYNN